MAHPFTLMTYDGTSLQATSFDPPAWAPTREVQVVFAGATGVPQGFYKSIATFLAEHGYRTTTFDFRGISTSKRQPLKGFKADFLTWARQDLASVIDQVDDAGRPASIAVVGHSFGGHAYGLLPNVERTCGLYAFGAGAGWGGWMPRHEARRVWVLWNVLGPVTTRALGYLPMSALGMGEDLPLGVYRQWRRWCGFPHYFFDDPRVNTQMHRLFDRVTQPVVFANAADDLWAPPASGQAFLKGYRKADTRLKVLESPGRVGHMGYVRSAHQAFWPNVVSWLERLQEAR